MQEEPWRDQQHHVCLREGRTSPIKQNHPAMFTILPSAEDIRITSTFIQITAWYPCTLLSYDVFFLFFFTVTGEIARGGFHANTQFQSAPRCYLFSPSPNETNRPAVSEMHYSSVYRPALQCIMFNFYSQRCCDTGLFLADETKPSVYMQRAAVRDHPQCKRADFRAFVQGFF